jgi:hypothetical protein
VVKSFRVVNRILVCRNLQFAYNLVKLNVLVKLRKAILSAFYNISQRNFGILLIL